MKCCAWIFVLGLFACHLHGVMNDSHLYILVVLMHQMKLSTKVFPIIQKYILMCCHFCSYMLTINEQALQVNMLVFSQNFFYIRFSLSTHMHVSYYV